MQGNEDHGRAKCPALMASRLVDEPLKSHLMEMGRFELQNATGQGWHLPEEIIHPWSTPASSCFQLQSTNMTCEFASQQVTQGMREQSSLIWVFFVLFFFSNEHIKSTPYFPPEFLNA